VVYYDHRVSLSVTITSKKLTDEHCRVLHIKQTVVIHYIKLQLTVTLYF